MAENIEMNNAVDVTEEATKDTKKEKVTRSSKKNTEEKKISVDVLIREYNKRATDGLKERYLKDVVKIRKYIPIEAKTLFCSTITAQTCYDQKGNFHVDSTKRYILYLLNLFMGWTNIDVSGEHWMQQYNRLEEAGLVNAVLSLIPNSEIEMVNSILKMQYDDLITNTYCVPAILRDMYSFVKAVIPELTNVLSNEVKDNSLADIIKMKSGK